MLSDFLTLEIYFGHESSAQFFEDLSRRHSPQKIYSAVKKGDLIRKTICIGPDEGRELFWLSAQGREKILERS